MTSGRSWPRSGRNCKIWHTHKKQKQQDIPKVCLPAIATLYFALAGIWGFPYGEEVVGTITAVDTFLGVLLGISSAQYNKKQVE